MIATTIFLTNCKKNEIPQDKLLNNNSEKRASGGDGKWDVLGYGLDVTGDILNINSISDAPIFDMQKFENDYIHRIDVNSTTENGDYFYIGASAYDYLKEISTGKSFGAGDTAAIKGTASPSGEVATDILNFKGSINKNSSDQSINTYSSKYSYATYEVTQRIKRIRFNQDVDLNLLIQYLTPEFLNNITNQNADALVQRYGTHVMLDISIGGRLRFNYSGAIFNESSYENKKEAVKLGLGISLFNVIGLNITSNKTKEEITKIVNETRSKEYTGQFFGGINSGRSITIDNNGNSSETINIANWQQSITDRNAALISVGKTIFLYDLITNPTKKALVKTAVEKHIKNAQVKLAAMEVYGFYNQSAGRNAYSLDPNMHDKYPGSGWSPDNQSFKAYPFPYYSAVPIYQFMSHTYNNRILTPNINLNKATYQYDGIMFYGYTSQALGSIPIYQFQFPTSKGGPNYFYSSNPNATNAWPGWIKEGVAFYAFPN
ncbi:MAC/perforin domain-containing protein [uncultured Sphingobacterium sp.]|uniref:MAC/perforin domain-containing protein n=1 Tax=uncultured Sphingobacterium sp. TaxID=182688 RepID=UPI0025DDC836|nr:MAC/perforin domain-containing protein [uncultured Sphingobacterium sp.]